MIQAPSSLHSVVDKRWDLSAFREPGQMQINFLLAQADFTGLKLISETSYSIHVGCFFLENSDYLMSVGYHCNHMLKLCWKLMAQSLFELVAVRKLVTA